MRTSDHLPQLQQSTGAHPSFEYGIAGKVSSPPIISAPVTEYKRGNVVSDGENASRKSLSLRPCGEIRTASAAQPSRRRPRPVPASSRGAPAAPPRADPAATFRCAHLPIASLLPGSTGWVRGSRTQGSPRRDEDYFLLLKFFRLIHRNATPGQPRVRSPGLRPSFSRHALDLSWVDLPRIPLSSVMVDFLKRPRHKGEKVEEGVWGRKLGALDSLHYSLIPISRKIAY